MTKKGALFNLVKSLSKSEKRHFRLSNPYSKKSNNYIKLFDAIDSQGDIDDGELKRMFNGEAFVKQLHVTKNYLANLILKGLRDLHGNQSQKSRLLEILNNVEVLFHRELYEHCLSELKRARIMVEKYEMFAYWLEVIGWERRLLMARKGPFGNQQQILQLIAEEADITDRISNYNEYNRLTFDLFNYGFEDHERLAEFRKHEILQDVSCARSFAAKTLYYHLHYVLYTIAGNQTLGENQLKTLIELFEENPPLISYNTESYITALNNLMGMYIYMKQTDLALQLLAKIRSVPDQYNLKKNNYTFRIFLKTYNVELELYRDLKLWDKGAELIEEIKQFIAHNIKSVPSGYFISFYYQFAYIYFMKEAYSKALVTLNSILNKNFNDERYDIQVYCRFLLLMIHFELENITVLKYAVENTRRFLKKNKKNLSTFESVLLKFFSKLSTSVPEDYLMLFKKLSKRLFTSTTDAQKTSILDYLDFEAWINHKIGNE